MQLMKTGSRVHYHDEPTWTGTILKARITGKGEDAEPKYLVRWDDEDPDEGPSQCWGMEILPAA